MKTKVPLLRLEALLLAALVLLQGCKLDSIPEPFTFASPSRVAPDTLVESDPLKISGIAFPAHVSITGGEYSIDGRAYRDGPGVVRNHQNIRLRVRSPPNPRAKSRPL